MEESPAGVALRVCGERTLGAAPSDVKGANHLSHVRPCRKMKTWKFLFSIDELTVPNPTSFARQTADSPLEPEREPAMAVAPGLEIALAKNVHADQRIEFEGVGQFDADDLVENEWKGRRDRRRLVRLNARYERRSARLGPALALR
jgi:hypothetical protein